MHKLLSLLSWALIALNVSAQTPPAFPMDSMDDYEVTGYQVKLAFPLEGKSRVWIKGSERLNFFSISNIAKQDLVKRTMLLPPDYTTVVSLGEDSAIITFDGSTTPSVKIGLQSSAGVERPSDSFSIAFYGCFEPFEVNKQAHRSQLNPGYNHNNFQMRTLLNKACLQKSANFDLFRRSETMYGYDTLSLNNREALWSPVTAIIGTGDQIYVDAGYGKATGKQNPMSLWEVKYRPMPILKNIDEYKRRIDQMYLHFGSFEKLNEIFRRIPSYSVWDDHDIRDGWGSQGDEYKNGNMVPTLQPYYAVTRNSYIDHTFCLGVSKQEKKTNNEDLHQQLIISGKKCFLFDLRSNRDIQRNQVIDTSQFASFRNWIGDLKENEEVVIVSSIPVFLSYKEIGKKLLSLFMRELKDDLRDGWDSKYNIAQRNEIISVLLEARIKKNIRPYIISGDVHAGGIMEIWYNDITNMNVDLCTSEVRSTRRVLAYELITTGLNHETLNQTKNEPGKFILKKKMQSHWSDEDLELLELNQRKYTISNISRIDQSVLNFGALEFGAERTKIHLVLSPYNQDGKMEEHIVYAEWNKREGDDRRYYYPLLINCRTFRYDAALPNLKREIYPE